MQIQFIDVNFLIVLKRFVRSKLIFKKIGL